MEPDYIGSVTQWFGSGLVAHSMNPRAGQDYPVFHESTQSVLVAEKIRVFRTPIGGLAAANPRFPAAGIALGQNGVYYLHYISHVQIPETTYDIVPGYVPVSAKHLGQALTIMNRTDYNVASGISPFKGLEEYQASLVVVGVMMALMEGEECCARIADHLPNMNCLGAWFLRNKAYSFSPPSGYRLCSATNYTHSSGDVTSHESYFVWTAGGIADWVSMMQGPMCRVTYAFHVSPRLQTWVPKESVPQDELAELAMSQSSAIYVNAGKVGLFCAPMGVLAALGIPRPICPLGGPTCIRIGKLCLQGELDGSLQMDTDLEIAEEGSLLSRATCPIDADIQTEYSEPMEYYPGGQSSEYLPFKDDKPKLSAIEKVGRHAFTFVPPSPTLPGQVDQEQQSTEQQVTTDELKATTVIGEDDEKTKLEERISALEKKMQAQPTERAEMGSSPKRGANHAEKPVRKQTEDEKPIAPAPVAAPSNSSSLRTSAPSSFSVIRTASGKSKHRGDPRKNQSRSADEPAPANVKKGGWGFGKGNDQSRRGNNWPRQQPVRQEPPPISQGGQHFGPTPSEEKKEKESLKEKIANLQNQLSQSQSLREGTPILFYPGVSALQPIDLQLGAVTSQLSADQRGQLLKAMGSLMKWTQSCLVSNNLATALGQDVLVITEKSSRDNLAPNMMPGTRWTEVTGSDEVASWICHMETAVKNYNSAHKGSTYRVEMVPIPFEFCPVGLLELASPLNKEIIIAGNSLAPKSSYIGLIEQMTGLTPKKDEEDVESNDFDGLPFNLEDYVESRDLSEQSQVVKNWISSHGGRVPQFVNMPMPVTFSSEIAGEYELKTGAQIAANVARLCSLLAGYEGSPSQYIRWGGHLAQADSLVSSNAVTIKPVLLAGKCRPEDPEAEEEHESDGLYCLFGTNAPPLLGERSYIDYVEMGRTLHTLLTKRDEKLAELARGEHRRPASKAIFKEARGESRAHMKEVLGPQGPSDLPVVVSSETSSQMLASDVRSMAHNEHTKNSKPLVKAVRLPNSRLNHMASNQPHVPAEKSGPLNESDFE